MQKGYLALVLHAHLPYVRHPEVEEALEERWLFEAITESYLPLLSSLTELVVDEIDFCLTISLSPTLLEMLADDLLQVKYLAYLNRVIRLAEKEVDRTTHADQAYLPLARHYLDKSLTLRKLYVSTYQGDLIGVFRDIKEKGKIELITSAGTHGYLPLMLTREAVAAQVRSAVDCFTRFFGEGPRGIWLPECGYFPNLDLILAEAGLDYFFVDTRGFLDAEPVPSLGVYAPVRTRSGTTVFGRDPHSSKEVWSKQEGYPGDYRYREYYRDIGFDLDYSYLRPFLPQDIRVNTGIKYYRITGPTEEKEIYNPGEAEARASDHATNFIRNRLDQIARLGGEMSQPPIIVAPYDAELFGHWWYEGPEWIKNLIRQLGGMQERVQLTTPSRFMKDYPAKETVNLPLSSWGDGGYNRVWLNGSNDWIYSHLHGAEIRMIKLANSFNNPGPHIDRALRQAARELLLAQASDWAFSINSGTVVDYAVRRTRNHLARFNALYTQLTQGNLQGHLKDEFLGQTGSMDRFFPDLKWDLYRAKSIKPLAKENYTGLSVLMLSWEFPPKAVGGLARHVEGLARALATQGLEIHVVTCAHGEAPGYEQRGALHIHRVETFGCIDTLGFLNWITQLNFAMLTRVSELVRAGYDFQLIHAHDWLVAFAARSLKNKLGIPLVLTIHATEHGRNQGIHNQTQGYIHNVETWATAEAGKVICCSQYMQEEISRLFNPPRDKVSVIPNGVEVAALSGTVDRALTDYRGTGRTVFFVGRLVPEKGVQTLIQAIPLILESVPRVRFVIAGEGPYRQILLELARSLEVEEHLIFHGFVDDLLRNDLYSQADVAVFPSLYEPFGIVALEAMASGTPVVVSDTGGLAEIVEDGVDGLKITPGDATSLAQAVLKILLSPALASVLGRRGREKVISRYGWTSISEKTQEVYLELLMGENCQRREVIICKQ
ncbi:MAG: 1,4-alpha-glucan branching protein domain-containing protein [Bacillota bacterium]